MKDKTQIWWSIVMTALVVLMVIGFAYFNKGNGGNITREGFFEGFMTLEKIAELSTCPLTDDKDAFAQCLTEKGWTMYGAEGCGHCQNQKALFGDSFKYITYIECPDNAQLCLNEGINGYPTWKVKK